MIQFNLFNPSIFLTVIFFYNNSLVKATWTSTLKCMFEEHAFKLQNYEANTFFKSVRKDAVLFLEKEGGTHIVISCLH